jgi:hypothetical protein
LPGAFVIGRTFTGSVGSVDRCGSIDGGLCGARLIVVAERNQRSKKLRRSG